MSSVQTPSIEEVLELARRLTPDQQARLAVQILEAMPVASDAPPFTTVGVVEPNTALLTTLPDGRVIARLGDAWTAAAHTLTPDADPIAEALDELRRERANVIAASGYVPTIWD